MDTTDVVVREGEVPPEIASARIRAPDCDVTSSTFLLRGGPRSADFLVVDGSIITVRKAPACEVPLFFHHLLYPVMAACLRQRELLVFHASVAALGGNAVLVTGASGAGKSTTIAALMTRGWNMQSDDVSAVRISADNVEALPGPTHVHLDEGAATRLGLQTAALVRHDWHRMKMAMPAVGPTERTPALLRRIVVLDNNSTGQMRVERVEGRAKLPLLLRALYGPLLPEQIDARTGMIARVLETVEFVTISRPTGEWTIDAVVEAITSGRGPGAGFGRAARQEAQAI